MVRGLADSGFFLPHSAVSGRNDYDSSIRKVFLFANMTAGANRACLSYYKSISGSSSSSSSGGSSSSSSSTTTTTTTTTTISGSIDLTSPTISTLPTHATMGVLLSVDDKDRSHCAFASNLYPHITTPTFTLQSQYDSWQAWNVLGDGDNRTALMEFGNKLAVLLKSSMQLLHSTTTTTTTSSTTTATISSPPASNMHGAFVESCWHHCYGCSYPLDSSGGSSGGESHDGLTLQSLSTTGTTLLSTQQLILEWMRRSELIERTLLPVLPPERLQPVFVFQNFSYPCKKCCQCSPN